MVATELGDQPQSFEARSAAKADEIIAKLDERIAYNRELIEPGTSEHGIKTDIIGNVASFLPVMGRMGQLSESDAQRVLEAFNGKTGYEVRWNEGNIEWEGMDDRE